MEPTNTTDEPNHTTETSNDPAGIEESKDFTEDQWDIIKCHEIEPIRSQLKSFARYINLPWDNLENFKKAVEAHEEKFEEHLKKEFAKRDSGETSLTATDSYFRNVFHIFNRLNTDPEYLEVNLNLRPIKSFALDLINLKGWSDYKDKKGYTFDSENMLTFLESITKLLLKINFKLPKLIPDEKIGSTITENRYLSLLPKLDTMKFNLYDDDYNADFLERRFELYFYALNPETILKNGFHAIFLEDDDTSSRKKIDINEATIKNYLMDQLGPPLKILFPKSILPKLSNGRIAKLSVGTEPVINLQAQSFTNSTLITEDYPSRLFYQTQLTSISGSIDTCISLSGGSMFEEDLDKYTHKLCLFELKGEGLLADLVRVYFKEKTSISDRKKRKRLSEDDKENASKCFRFDGFLKEATSFCKMNGTLSCIITNGYDILVLRTHDLYGKINADECGPIETNLFGDWDILLYEGKNLKFSFFTILSSAIINETKQLLDHQFVANFQLTNYHLSHGASDRKKSLDKIGYMLSRETFKKLMLKFVLREDRLKIKAPWVNDPDIKKIFGLKKRSLGVVIDNSVEKIKLSNEWKESTKKAESSEPLRIYDSSDFKVSNVLQNEILCMNVGATTMRASFNNGANQGVLKIFDINRMPHSYDLLIQYKRGAETISEKATLQAVLRLSYEFWLNEVTIYQLLKEKAYVPDLIDAGFLYISDLEPSSSSEAINMYENYLIRSGRALKTEAPFLYIEYIERVPIEDLSRIDFAQLKTDAFADLEEMHNMLIFHCDICSRNIIIKRLDDGTHRVIFIDFGHSIILRDNSKTTTELRNTLKDLDNTALKEAIDYYLKRSLFHKEISL